MTNSKNVCIDGITVLNPRHYTVFGGASSDITIKNLKSFSAGSWTDGFDLMSCHDVDIENVFLRTSDDCLAFYGHRWWYWGNTYNINVSSMNYNSLKNMVISEIFSDFVVDKKQ